MLKKFGMESYNPAHTPGTPTKLVDDAPEETFLEPSEKTKYQAMVGSLIFLAQSTRFNIALSVSQVARHMSSPSRQTLVAVKRIFRYLKGKPDLPLTYSTSNEDLVFKGFCDPSYGNTELQGIMRSTKGTLFFLSNGLVQFTPSLQRITATFNCPFEMRQIRKVSLQSHTRAWMVIY
ncbi:unnamed protein product [Sphacelaria rigidula]